jgi:hypothetical protein
LAGITGIFNPYICFEQWIVIFRGYLSEKYKFFLHPSVHFAEQT